MPTYEYICPTCKRQESYFHGINQTLSPICSQCFLADGKECSMKKGLGGGSAVHFKGSGFYETDYKKK